ncbi:MAG: prephenate dehydrogenase/arogenate dehydrogenase family protein [Candidatus Omnitrophica bacterium]|nr:prephenate dehydrogenase/arogenate dehydrogenase family protein [Candidatus Omnitrophota bacterium]
MILPSHRPFRQITIIGVGMMGGSLGLAIKKHKLAKEVVGLSFQQSSLIKAMKIGAVDVATTDLAKAIRNTDLIILATPVETIIQFLPKINPYLRKNCYITDIGSTKSDIVDMAAKLLAFPDNFVGSHPLAGSEKRGVENAVDSLFTGAKCILTPIKTTHHTAFEKVKLFWTKLGTEVLTMEPEQHDQVLAYISHLPHMAAFSLMGAVPDEMLQYAANGLKDSTRIAASSPQMWADICLSNGKYIIKAVDDIVKQLSIVRQAIIAKDEKILLAQFEKAKAKREKLN